MIEDQLEQIFKTYACPVLHMVMKDSPEWERDHELSSAYSIRFFKVDLEEAARDGGEISELMRNLLRKYLRDRRERLACRSSGDRDNTKLFPERGKFGIEALRPFLGPNFSAHIQDTT